MTDSPLPSPTTERPPGADDRPSERLDRAPDPLVEPLAAPAAEADAAEQAQPPDPVRVLSTAVSALEEALAASRVAQDHQRDLLDKLHDERQLLRDAERDRMRDPVLRDLVQLADTTARNGRQWRARTDVAPETAEAVGGVLVDVADDVRLLLERQGVDAFAPEVGDSFDRTTARAVATRSTTDPLREGTVAEVRKPGYRVNERVIRYCDVVVWHVEPDPAASTRS